MEFSERLWCIGLAIMAMMMLVGGWVVGAFAVAPMHCLEPACEQWAQQLLPSLVGSLVGVGCLVLAVINIRPEVVLLLGAGLLGLTALAGLANPGLIVINGVNFLLVAGVVGWFLVRWLDQ